MGRGRACEISLNLCSIFVTESPYQRDTLIRYLLDELHTYEEDHSDALNPTKLQPVEQATTHSTPDPLLVNLFTIVQSIQAGVSQLQAWQQQLSEPSSRISSDDCLPPPNRISMLPVFFPHYSQPPSQVHGTWSAGPLITHLGPLTSTHAQSASLTQGPPPSFLADAPCLPVIPEIDRRAGGDGWRQLVKDWETADPQRGLLTPLKDWPKHWYDSEGVNRKALYGQREIIAKEFIERYVSLDQQHMY
jgi:hypothetical protein